MARDVTEILHDEPLIEICFGRLIVVIRDIERVDTGTVVLTLPTSEHFLAIYDSSSFN
jgi:hypothetical protein